MIEVPLVKYSILIPLINALSSFPLFNENRTSLHSSELPFFEHYQLLEAQTFSTIPPVKIHYLWNPNDNDVIKMDGTRDAVFNQLDKLHLILNNQTIVPYVQFVLDNVQSEDGTLRLVQSESEIEYSDTPSPEQLAFLKQHVSPAKIVEEDEGYYISCNVIYGTTLYDAKIRLEYNGTFDFISERQVGQPMQCLRQLFLE